MRFLCWFSQCRWYYLGCVILGDTRVHPGGVGQHLGGLYQCMRCKTMSLGSPSDPAIRRPEHYAPARETYYP